jgi:hypothetical protein
MNSSNLKQMIIKLICQVEDLEALEKVLNLLQDSVNQGEKETVSDSSVEYLMKSYLEGELDQRSFEIEKGNFLSMEELENEAKSW